MAANNREMPDQTIPTTCPTCGGTGPDVMDPAGDYGGSWELRCGDDWHHDQPEEPRAVDEEEQHGA